MPARKKQTQKGRGIMDVLKYAKDNKLLSSGLSLIPHPAAQGLSQLASMVGLGKKKPKKKKSTQRGRGIFGDFGGGVGSILGGLGGGLGSAFGGLFGRGHKKVRKNVIVM